MTTHKMIFGSAICLLLAVLIGPSPAQMRRQSEAGNQPAGLEVSKPAFGGDAPSSLRTTNPRC